MYFAPPYVGEWPMVKYIYLHKAQEKTHIVLFRYEKYECVHVWVCVCVCVEHTTYGHYSNKFLVGWDNLRLLGSATG